MKSFPEVNLCLAVSLDGRISRGKGAPPDFTSRYDRDKLFRLRASSDALLIGANTVREEALPPIIRNQDLVAQRRQKNMPDHPAAVIVSGSLNLPWDTPYFHERQQELYILTGKPDAERRQKLTSIGVHLLETGEPLSLRRGLQQLGERGYGVILAEGGGGLVRNLLADGLVHRLYLTVAPLVIGDEGPPLCGGPLPYPGAGFHLVEHHLEGDEWHLVYQFEAKR